jgi:prepilin-type N-terminal cleavage/methylation domain-containing protein
MRSRPDNKGFSLVEVLIGVTILAIIAMPLAHAFITSAKTSAKAQVIRRETVAAQNILESYEATDIATVFAFLQAGADPFNGLGGIESVEMYDEKLGGYVPVTDYAEAETDGPAYRITLTGVDDGEYDAIVNITPTGNTATSMKKRSCTPSR